MATKKQARKKVTKVERPEIKIAFNSSMPRSGSELLQGLLSQHPDVCAGTTSPLLEYVYASYKNFKDTQEAISQKNSEVHFSSFIKGGVLSYAESYRDANQSFYLDKSRGWVHYGNLVEKALEKEIPVVCMVRDIADIAASMERISRENDPSHRDPLKLVTMEERMTQWFTATPIGLAIRRIQNALSSKRRIFFVRYEDLCSTPESVMKQVTDYIGLPEFKFNFDKIEKASGEDELAFGFKNIHTVQTKLRTEHPKAEDTLGGLASSLRQEYSGYQKLFQYSTE